MAYYATVYNQAIHGLGQAGCPPCTITAGAQCLPCPEGADLPECEGCVGGRLPEAEVAWADRSKWVYPVVMAVVSAIAVGLATAYATRKLRIPAGG